VKGFLFGFELVDKVVKTIDRELVGDTSDKRSVMQNDFIDFLTFPAHREFFRLYAGNGLRSTKFRDGRTLQSEHKRKSSGQDH
jgi:hypothetical protein